MPVTTNKQRVLAALFTTLRKHYGDPGAPPDRPVLEQMVYAVLREGSTRKDTDKAFDRLQKHFFDWNEVRVSSPHEVEEALAGLPDAAAKAQRVVGLLQEVFESTFTFDLEALNKKGLKQAAKQIGRYQAADDYTVAWVTQQSLGGHAIPVDAPTLRTVIRLGLTEGESSVEAVRASLEHQVPKAKGPAFVEYVSLLARDYCFEEEPNCSACPMKGECLTGTTDERCQGGGGGSRRPKPR
jgi:endonuclease III